MLDLVPFVYLMESGIYIFTIISPHFLRELVNWLFYDFFFHLWHHTIFFFFFGQLLECLLAH
jgi:hypothetical protein